MAKQPLDELKIRLSPELREAFEKLPAPMAARIAELVTSLPAGLGIRTDQLVKYAFLVVVAERKLESAGVSSEHTARARAEIMGEQHGFDQGYKETAEAQLKYRRGRQARQKVEASLKSTLKAWKRTEEVMRRNRADLPTHVRKTFSDARITAMATRLENMQRAVELDSSAPRDPNAPESTRSISTFSMWRHLIPAYRGKMQHMHTLAQCWHLTTAKDTQSFRRIVQRAGSGLEKIEVPFGRRWIELLSKHG